MNATQFKLVTNKNRRFAYIELFYNNAARFRELRNSYVSTSSGVKSLPESFTGAIIPFADAAGVFFCQRVNVSVTTQLVAFTLERKLKLTQFLFMNKADIFEIRYLENKEEDVNWSN